VADKLCEWCLCPRLSWKAELQNNPLGRVQWLMPIILVSWEAEIEEFTVLGQSREKSL
jgi:hypothetical protein